ncbi:MAG: DNA topoisomerase I, partial [Bacillales bacterium]|nr:DNA topoisomerase I [Bacillales bacterium]
MKKIVIVESPTKQKTIAKFLPEGYQVTASRGHIRDLAIVGPGGLGVDIKNNFKPTYVISENKESTVKYLKSIAQGNEVILATDPDREGEAIAWHIADELGLDLKTTTRLEFHEITKSGIENALKQPKLVDLDLVNSQEARRIIDRIIGFKLSKLVKEKVNSESAGRVQSAVLKMIIDKQKEIDDFQKETYYDITATYKENYIFNLNKINDVKVEKITNIAKDIVDNFDGTLKITSVITEEKTHYPSPVYTTSSLQIDASRKLNFTAKKTMQLAQNLYEGKQIGNRLVGLITYMRTDSTNVSGLFISLGRKKLSELLGNEYVSSSVMKGKTLKGAQEAHEGIRPTQLDIPLEDLAKALSKDEYKLYELIYYRALSALAKPRLTLDTTILATSNIVVPQDSITFQTVIQSSDSCPLEFKLVLSRTTFEGFCKLSSIFKYTDTKKLEIPETNTILKPCEIK